MESSSLNTQMNRATSAPVKQDHHDTTLANLRPYSSEHRKSPVSNPDPSPVLEPPPNQEMNHAPSGYRIPSSVFERSASSTPLDWSVASNESLFSIHTGNMNDHYLWRSGELGPAAEASTSDHMFSYSADESGSGGRELGIAEATMLEVIKESEGKNNVEKTSLSEIRKVRRSEGSNTSNKSFAFSLLGGDVGSPKMGASEVRSNQEPAQSESVQPPESQPDRTTPTDAEKGAQSSWFSCFSCCSSRL